jgi:glucose/arabinose dehydrogenase
MLGNWWFSMLSGRTIAIAISGALLALAQVNAAPAATPLTTQRVASMLENPVYVTHAPGDFDRIFIVQQTGEIRILDFQTGKVLRTPFLDLSSTVSCCLEFGLLAMAFHPDYATNGYFFVYYTDTSQAMIVERYSVSGDPATSNVADPQSAFPLFVIPQPAPNHNGGWLGFGPNDGYLYITTGDGGFFCDPDQVAQDITNERKGKILRVDVDSGSPYAIPSGNPFVNEVGDDEIWAYGLRNSFRAAFDSETGNFYIADVGARSVEEVNIQLASSSGGENYGWDCMEGDQCSTVSDCMDNGCTCNEAGLTLPAHTYTHADGLAITGGEVYRGCAISDLDGSYFFADYVNGRIWSFEYTTMVENLTERTSELAPGQPHFIGSISSFGRDALGEIYICDLNDGEIFKIVPDTGGPSLDCNENLIEDACDIRSGTSTDINKDLIPDECGEPVPALSRPGLAFVVLLIFATGVSAALRVRRRA